MTPKLLKFCAVGPYNNAEMVDFEQLNNSKLFLISGATGSGKTYILDCIMQALYGESAGGSRDDLKSMRCQFASENKQSYIEFIFSINDNMYKFERGLRLIKKRDGSIDYEENCNALVLRNSVFVSVFDNPTSTKISKYACEIIGLNADQFRQVIILPQGKFESFLLASVEDKEKILKTLFNTTRWEIITRNIKDKSNAAKREYDELSRDYTKLLESQSCQTTDELIAAIDGKIRQKKDVENDIIVLKKQLQDKQDYKNAMRILNDKFAELEKKHSGLKQLSDKASEIEMQKAELEKNIRARELQPYYGAYSEIKEDFKNLKNEYIQKQNALKILEENNLNILNEQKRLLIEKDKIDGIKERLPKLKNASDSYANLGEVKNLYNSTEAELLRLNQNKQMLNEQKDKIDKEYDLAFNAFITNSAVFLATTLKDGQPCPVCGSTTHNKHSTTNNKMAEGFSGDKLNVLVAQRKDIENKLKNVDDGILQAKTQSGKLEVKITELSRYLISDINSLPELERLIRENEQSINIYERSVKDNDDKLKVTQSEYDGAVVYLNNLETGLREQKDRLDKRKEVLMEKVLRAEFFDIEDFLSYLISDDEITIKRQCVEMFKVQITALNNEISNLESELNDKTRPNLIEIDREINELTEKNKDIQILYGRLDANILDKQKLLDRIKNIEKNKTELLNDFAFISEFANQLSGTNSVSLQNYILSKALKSVTIEANKLLKSIDGGRFQLVVGEGTDGRKKKFGLNLEVSDSYSDKTRSVASLSGGERFYVALVLCLGLSAVVQAENGGIKMETLFIDEGFGTLSESVLDDSLAILSQLVGSRRVVGIISHVEKLKENIPTKISVVKKSKGSTVKIEL